MDNMVDIGATQEAIDLLRQIDATLPVGVASRIVRAAAHHLEDIVRAYLTGR